MRSIKLLLLMLLMGAACSVSAQDDDWQIGGGFNSHKSSGNGQSRLRVTYENTNYNPSSVNLWNGGYDKQNVAFLMGYVNKQWTSKYASCTRSENLFGEENKRLHGMQIGMQFTPSFDFGLGARTGIFYECYFSSSRYVKDQQWDKFTEHDLYIPAQLMMRIPFTQHSSIAFFGGIGFQWAIYGNYREWGHTYYDYYDGTSHYVGPETQQQYGDGWPRHVNWQLEGGISLFIDAFTFNCSYSYGLTNHRLYSSELGYASESRQDKMQFSIGFAF